MTSTRLATIAPSTDLATSARDRLDIHPAAVYLASLAPGSRRTMRQALDTIAGILTDEQADAFTLTWGALRYQHTAAVRAVLQERYAPATANKMLVALRRVLKEARRLGQIAQDDYAAAIDLGHITGDRPAAAAGRALPPGELRALLTSCTADHSPAGVRDAALIGLAYAAGLRRAELVSLDPASLDATTTTFIVHGKRNKTRAIPIEGGALEALEDWLDLRGTAAGPLFVRILKGANSTTARLTPQAVYHIQHARANAAGVAAFSPHDLRRTFAGDLLDAGVDLATVQKLMGHSDANTTSRYDRRGERDKRHAVSMLHGPYQRRRDEGTKNARGG